MLAGLFCRAAAALPATGDTTADAVLGQADFAANQPNAPAGAVTALGVSLSNAAHAAVGPDGRLWLSDPDNNRVLSWPSAAAFATGQPADRVLGQPDFFSHAPNFGGVSGASLSLPQGIAVDSAGNVWLADAFNHRVLRYNNPAVDATPAVADLVIGQVDLNHNQENLGLGGMGPAVALPDSIQFPGRVLVRGSDVYVADSGNSRVLHYTLPFGNKPLADRVFGQYGDFTRRAKNNDGSGNNNPCCPTPDNLYNPIGIALDAAGRLFVADWNNHRVLRFDAPLASQTASAVIGQLDFFHRDIDAAGPGDGLQFPIDLAIDAAGRLWAADSGNNRVLAWFAPLAGGPASAVFGQLGSLLTDDANHGLGFLSSDADGLFGPTGVIPTPAGDLLVVDTNNHRLLRFDRPFAPAAGDVNCDGAVNAADAAALLLALVRPADYAAAYPGCGGADVNGDTATDGRDVAALVAVLP